MEVILADQHLIGPFRNVGFPVRFRAASWIPTVKKPRKHGERASPLPVKARYLEKGDEKKI
jgi:hypothetical protein